MKAVELELLCMELQLESEFHIRFILFHTTFSILVLQMYSDNRNIESCILYEERSGNLTNWPKCDKFCYKGLFLTKSLFGTTANRVEQQTLLG